MQKRRATSQAAAPRSGGGSVTVAPIDLYRVVFDTCGPFVAGEVAAGSALGDEKGLSYLLRIGAVVRIENAATGGDA